MKIVGARRFIETVVITREALLPGHALVSIGRYRFFPIYLRRSNFDFELIQRPPTLTLTLTLTSYTKAPGLRLGYVF